MYETVKVVNGYEIKRMCGTHSAYHIETEKTEKHTKTYYFNTQKAAAAFAAALPARK